MSKDKYVVRIRQYGVICKVVPAPDYNTACLMALALWDNYEPADGYGIEVCPKGCP